jgi:tungstate transport system permease protein
MCGKDLMGFLTEGIGTAARLIAGMDPDFWEIVLLTLSVSLVATVLAAAAGIPLAFLIATKDFRGREIIVTIVNTLMALPTVAIGLLVYAFLSRRGPLGFLGLLHTPAAIIAGEFILALPIVTALSIAGLRSVDRRALPTARTLGVRGAGLLLVLLGEAKFALLAALAAGFGRVVTEVGSAIMVGGNIAHYTRTMSTAIALETSKGEFGLGMGLGIVLVVIALTVNIAARLAGGVAR